MKQRSCLCPINKKKKEICPWTMGNYYQSVTVVGPWVWVTFSAGSPTNLDLRKGGGYWACSNCGWGVFSLPVRMYRESYYTNPGLSVGRAIRVSKMLKFTVKFYCMARRCTLTGLVTLLPIISFFLLFRIKLKINWNTVSKSLLT